MKMQGEHQSTFHIHNKVALCGEPVSYGEAQQG